MFNPALFDRMSWRMSQVYASIVDRLLVNIARHFPYMTGKPPGGTFEYLVRMLAQLGQVNQESVDIIVNGLSGADQAVRDALIAAIKDVLKDVDPPLRKAAEAGLFGQQTFLPPIQPNQTQAFMQYYRQSADKLNLVNTVMLESTQHAYSSTVTDIVQKMNQTQGILNAGAGEMIAGTATWNQVVTSSVQAMIATGITGFIDHANRHWSPEAYVAMDVRTTMSNVARATIWEENSTYGNDLYVVSTHAGARPLCYPWQAKVISQIDAPRIVTDLNGNTIQVYAQSETTYGEPAGLFGINCRHYPMPFFPGLSMIRGEPQDQETNDRMYQEEQHQRRLERELRYAKRDYAVEKARGAPPEVLGRYKDRVDRASGRLSDFCEETGRNRKRNRERTPVQATFPAANNPAPMPTQVQQDISQYYQGQPN